LLAGDRVVSVDNQPMCSTNDLFAFESSRLGKQVTFGFVRNGQFQSAPVTLNSQMPGIGAEIMTQRATDGFGVQKISDHDPVFVNQPLPIGTAIQQGLSDTWGVVYTTLDVPARLLRGTLTLQDAHPVSVVGISQMGAQVIQSAIDEGQTYPILRFAAVIGVAIGLTQLIPIPGLDGGRILFVIIELVRGKPMKPEREGFVHLIGLMLLLGFMLIFVVNDLINPVLLPR
jgi:regulator of sigma E protease